MQTLVESRSIPDYYSVQDLQQMLGIGRSSAYKLVRSKGFPVLYVGNRAIIPGDLLQQWVLDQAQTRKGRNIYATGKQKK